MKISLITCFFVLVFADIIWFISILVEYFLWKKVILAILKKIVMRSVISGLPSFAILHEYLKLVSVIFYQIFISHQIIALQKLWKMLFHLLCSFHSPDIQIFVIPSSLLFTLGSHCFRCWSKINLKVYDVINCLNKNLITYFAWYLEKEKRYEIETLSIDRVLNKEHF